MMVNRVNYMATFMHLGQCTNLLNMVLNQLANMLQFIPDTTEMAPQCYLSCRSQGRAVYMHELGQVHADPYI